MLYQKLLMKEHPYSVTVWNVDKFEKHRHPDIELNFCLKGCYTIKINHNTYTMKEGDLAISLPMFSHEIICRENTFAKSLTIVVGTTLLSEYFEYFCKTDITDYHFHLDSKNNKALYDLLCETAGLRENPSDYSELIIRGNLHKICALVLENFIATQKTEDISKSLRAVSNIEKALELIYHHFTEELRIEDVANLCGYSKSNFCKNFKNITGTTFHNFLNEHRVRVAQDLLNETNSSIEEIAIESGFPDSKSLCRVFKKVTNSTPGEYRRNGSKKAL